MNEALARRRRGQLTVVELDDVVEHRGGALAAPSAASDAEDEARRRFLAEQIKALPFEYRAPLVLRDVLGLSNKEVGEILELSVAAAKSRVHRARMQIRADLEAWERASE